MTENKTVMVAMDERDAYHRSWAPPLHEATAFLDKVLLSSSYGSNVVVRAESFRYEGKTVANEVRSSWCTNSEPNHGIVVSNAIDQGKEATFDKDTNHS